LFETTGLVYFMSGSYFAVSKWS